jgi:hypothetical protein
MYEGAKACGIGEVATALERNNNIIFLGKLRKSKRQLLNCFYGIQKSIY